VGKLILRDIKLLNPKQAARLPFVPGRLTSKPPVFLAIAVTSGDSLGIRNVS
jgi:hypothetical protein